MPDWLIARLRLVGGADFEHRLHDIVVHDVDVLQSFGLVSVVGTHRLLALPFDERSRVLYGMQTDVG